jgi:hypothetical protein
VRWSSANPLLGQRQFVVEPVHYEGVKINQKSEADFLSDKSSDQVASWQADKADANKIFFENVAAKTAGLTIASPTQTAGSGTFTIRPICTSIETGSLNAVDKPTEMRLTVQVLDSNGGLIDEITSAIAVASQIWNPSSGGRLRRAAVFHGTQVADYLHVRTGI